MKVSVSDDKGFKPFDLIITVESEDEARILHAIFNHTDNADLLGSSEAVAIYKRLEKFAGSGSDVISHGVQYRDWYGKRR